MRLNKYIARCGVTSRRKADDLVFAGRVRINGNTADHPAIDVGKEDVVEVDGEVVSLEEEKVYYALNKPVGYVTTNYDPHEDLYATDLIDAEERIYPVGRLDKDSEGLLLFTNDGDLTYRITHPKFGLKKKYRVTVFGHPKETDIRVLEKGIELNGYSLNECEIRELEQTGKTSVWEVVIDEGRKRQIRRMFDYIGYPVKALVRIAVGPVRLGDLAPGKYRRLTEEEEGALKKLCYR